MKRLIKNTSVINEKSSVDVAVNYANNYFYVTLFIQTEDDGMVPSSDNSVEKSWKFKNKLDAINFFDYLDLMQELKNAKYQYDEVYGVAKELYTMDDGDYNSILYEDLYV